MDRIRLAYVAMSLLFVVPSTAVFAESSPKENIGTRLQLGGKLAWSPSGDHVQAFRLASYFPVMDGRPVLHVGPELAFGRLKPGTSQYSIENDQFWGSLGVAAIARWQVKNLRLDVGAHVSTVLTPWDRVAPPNVNHGIDIGGGGGLLGAFAVTFGSLSLGFRVDAMAHYMNVRGLTGFLGGDLFVEVTL